MAYWGSSPQFSVGELSFNHFHLKWKPFSLRLGQGGCTSDPSRFFGSDFQCQSFRGSGKPIFCGVWERWWVMGEFHEHLRVVMCVLWDEHLGLSFGGLIPLWLPSFCLWKLRAETWTTQTLFKRNIIFRKVVHGLTFCQGFIHKPLTLTIFLCVRIIFILRFHGPHCFLVASPNGYIFAVEEVKHHQPSNNQLSIFPRTGTFKREATTTKTNANSNFSKNTYCSVFLPKK